ncbi:hypothetical protein FACS1894198_6550 [Clostridia bacterium]|nr:hypothetical protein FACS1894198_6550 [Clostridia bacterium]
MGRHGSRRRVVSIFLAGAVVCSTINPFVVVAGDLNFWVIGPDNRPKPLSTSGLSFPQDDNEGTGPILMSKTRDEPIPDEIAQHLALADGITTAVGNIDDTPAVDTDPHAVKTAEAFQNALEWLMKLNRLIGEELGRTGRELNYSTDEAIRQKVQAMIAKMYGIYSRRGDGNVGGLATGTDLTNPANVNKESLDATLSKYGNGQPAAGEHPSLLKRDADNEANEMEDKARRACAVDDAWGRDSAIGAPKLDGGSGGGRNFVTCIAPSDEIDSSVEGHHSNPDSLATELRDKLVCLHGDEIGRDPTVFKNFLNRNNFATCGGGPVAGNMVRFDPSRVRDVAAGGVEVSHAGSLKKTDDVKLGVKSKNATDNLKDLQRYRRRLECARRAWERMEQRFAGDATVLVKDQLDVTAIKKAQLDDAETRNTVKEAIEKAANLEGDVPELRRIDALRTVVDAATLRAAINAFAVVADVGEELNDVTITAVNALLAKPFPYFGEVLVAESGWPFVREDTSMNEALLMVRLCKGENWQAQLPQLLPERADSNRSMLSCAYMAHALPNDPDDGQLWLGVDDKQLRMNDVGGGDADVPKDTCRELGAWACDAIGIWDTAANQPVEWPDGRNNNYPACMTILSALHDAHEEVIKENTLLSNVPCAGIPPNSIFGSQGLAADLYNNSAAPGRALSRSLEGVLQDAIPEGRTVQEQLTRVIKWIFYWSIERAKFIMEKVDGAESKAALDTVCDYLGGGSNYSVRFVGATVNGRSYSSPSECPIKVEIVSSTSVPKVDTKVKCAALPQEGTLTEKPFAIKIYCPDVVDGKTNSDADFTIEFKILDNNGGYSDEYVGSGKFSGIATKAPEATINESGPSRVICVKQSGQIISQDLIYEIKESREKRVTIEIPDGKEPEVVKVELDTSRLKAGLKPSAELVAEPKVEKMYNKNGTEIAVVDVHGVPGGGKQVFSVLREWLGGAWESIRNGQKGPGYLGNREDMENNLGKQPASAVRAAAATDGCFSTDPARMIEWKCVNDYIEFTLDHNVKDYNPDTDVIMLATKPISEENMVEIPEPDAEKKSEKEEKEAEVTKEDADVADNGDDDEDNKAPEKLKDANIAGGSADDLLASKGADASVPEAAVAVKNNIIARGGSANSSVFSVIALLCLVGAVVTFKKKKS